MFSTCSLHLQDNRCVIHLFTFAVRGDTKRGVFERFGHIGSQCECISKATDILLLAESTEMRIRLLTLNMSTLKFVSATRSCSRRLGISPANQHL